MHGAGRRPRGAARARLLAVALVAALAATVAAGPASADSVDDGVAHARAQQKANDKAEAAAEAAEDGVSADLQAVSDALAATQAKIPAAQRALDTAQAAADAADREAQEARDRLEDAQDQQSTLTAQIGTEQADATRAEGSIGDLARAAYQAGPLSALDVVLGAGSTDDFVERYGMVSTAMRTQSRVLSDLRTAEADDRNAKVRLGAVTTSIADLEAQLEAKQAAADTARDGAQQARSALTALVGQQTSEQAQLEAKKADLKAQLAKIDAESSRVANELKKAIAAQRARDAKAHHPVGPSTPIHGALFVNPTSVNPIYVTSPYGWRFHPILHYYRMHSGIDLRTYCHTPIYAGRAGTVEWAKYLYGFGSQVMVDHGFVDGNAVASSYNHLSQMVVHAGQHVSTGQLVGYSGSEGLSTGCHLHFEVYINGNTVNPAPYLGL